MATETFYSPSGSAYTWTAPSDQTITIKVTGPGGGGGSDDTDQYVAYDGGNGGYIEVDYSISSNETLDIYVGGGGGGGYADGSAAEASGGSGGVGRYSGGSGTSTAGSGQADGTGGGGGSSEVLLPSGDIIAAAGGGGGGGHSYQDSGGGGAQGGSGATDGGGPLTFGGDESSNASYYHNQGTLVTGTDGGGAAGGSLTSGGGQAEDGYDGEVVIEYVDAPAAPSNLKSSVSADDISLTWDNVDNEDGYYVYRAQSSGSSTSDYTQIADLAADTTSYTDSGLLDGEQYFYRVSAYGNGESDLSNEADATTDLPAVENFTSAVQSPFAIELTWNDVINNENGFTVYYRPSGGTFSQFSDLGANTESETVNSLSSDTQYDFRVDVYTDHATTQSTIVSETTATNLQRYSTVHGNGTVSHSDRVMSKDRGSTAFGNGFVQQVREVSKNRSAETHGSGGVGTLWVSTTRYATATSYTNPLWSTARNERTSMELVDFDVTYDVDDLAWYTNWFPEDKVLPEQHDLALQMQTAPQADDPVAVIHVEYDANGNGDVDSRSEPIYVNESELVHDVTGVPSSEDGYYRLRIHDYGGYNDIYNINLGIVH